MAKAIDLTGRRFGKLVVQKRVDKPKDRNQKGIYWECLCDCGNTCIRNGDNLKKTENKGGISACDECKKINDLTGKRYGKLLVIKRHDKDYVFSSGRISTMWECKCDCGNYHIARGWDLESGDTTSCGCYKKEVATKNLESTRKYNTYDLESKEYGIGYTAQGEEFWFDKEDYEKIKDNYWYFDEHGYVITRLKEENKKQISLHRIIMNANEGSYVDHIIHPPRSEHKIDNRKSNLRIVTNSQNCMNASMKSNNTSGITGVYWHKQHNCWQVSIGYQNKQIHIGYFENFEDAIEARKEAEEKYFGGYSYDNSQKKGA